MGASLVAFNDVTKKATATIDLKKAIAVEDDEETLNEVMSPVSVISPRSSRYVEFDVPYGVERSFRLVFPDDQEIIFFADTDEEKDKWYIAMGFGLSINADYVFHQVGSFARSRGQDPPESFMG